MPSPRPAIFTDRDGTLNVQVVRDGKPYAPATVAEFRLFPGVPEACRSIKAAGYALVVATNQPDVGRGTQSLATVEAMHARLMALIPEIDRIEVSYNPGEGPAPAASGKPPSGRLSFALKASHGLPAGGSPDAAGAGPYSARRRKPEPGMLLDAAAALGLDLSRSWMIGDRWRDVDCGKRAGVRTVFIDWGYAERLDAAPDFTVSSFADAVDTILREDGNTPLTR
jgi:D-glycero-D-manno-heptose 1,7-bisphosphate phosphatase